jgi:hypothetical protein
MLWTDKQRMVDRFSKEKIMKRCKSILMLLALGVFAAGSAHAAMTVSGTVADPNGHGLPGVQVSAVLKTGTPSVYPHSMVVKTDALGHYSIVIYTDGDIAQANIGYWYGTFIITPTFIAPQTGTFTPTSVPTFINIGAAPNTVVNFTGVITVPPPPPPPPPGGGHLPPPPPPPPPCRPPMNCGPSNN